MTVYGGFRYLTSAGNPSAMSDANSQIFAGLIGLIVILSSWLLLTTINPQLIVINPQLKESELVVGEMPGVYLCRDAAGTDCQVFTEKNPDIGDLRGEVRYVKFNNSGDIKYGAVLHEEKNYEGRCAICLVDGCNDGYNDISYVGGVSSITVFFPSDSSEGEGVTLYETEEYNIRCGEECYKTCSLSPCGDGCAGVWPKRSGLCWGPFREADPDFDSQQGVWSVEINKEGKWLAALFTGSNYQDNCEIFMGSDPNTQIDNYLKRKRIWSFIALPIK